MFELFTSLGVANKGGVLIWQIGRGARRIFFWGLKLQFLLSLRGCLFGSSLKPIVVLRFRVPKFHDLIEKIRKSQ